jgi:hypothetical protein
MRSPIHDIRHQDYTDLFTPGYAPIQFGDKKTHQQPEKYNCCYQLAQSI